MSGEIFSLSGQVALVTGGGRGIGAAIAVGLAEAGADVVLVGRNELALGETAQRISALGRRALPLSADVTDLDELPGLIARAEEQLGPLTVLVNNAGGNRPQKFLEVTLESFEYIFRLNLTSAFFLSQAAAVHMVSRGYGRIIHISSQLGLVGQPHRSVYSAAKGALIALTRTMALELSPMGVTVNAVAPTVTPTEATAHLLDDPAYQSEVLRRLPAGRMGTPDDVAAAVRYLASPSAAMVTGHTLVVDGGWTAQ